MAANKKETVTFLIGDEDEEDSSTKTANNKINETTTVQLHILNDSAVCKDNVRDINLMETREEGHKRRRQSDVCIPTNYNPTRGAKCDRNRHSSDKDSISRRFVLNPSSKVPLEVRRNHSGFYAFKRKECF